MENKTITQIQNEKFTWIGGQNRLKTYAKDDVSINLNILSDRHNRG